MPYDCGAMSIGHKLTPSTAGNEDSPYTFVRPAAAASSAAEPVTVIGGTGGSSTGLTPARYENVAYQSTIYTPPEIE
jgi:hypothetical protein